MKNRHISKQLFKGEVIALSIISPIIFGISTLFLFVIISPFIVNYFTDHDSFYISAMISILIIILPMWSDVLFKHRIDPSDTRYKIEHVAGLISNDFSLNFDEVKLKNKVNGWKYKDNKRIRLNENELKEAFLLANETELDLNRLHFGYNPRTRLGIILTFLVSLVFLSPLKKWKNQDNWPIIIIGLLLLCFSLYLYITYRKAKKYFKDKNQEIEE